MSWSAGSASNNGKVNSSACSIDYDNSKWCRFQKGHNPTKGQNPTEPSEALRRASDAIGNDLYCADNVLDMHRPGMIIWTIVVFDRGMIVPTIRGLSITLLAASLAAGRRPNSLDVLAYTPCPVRSGARRSSTVRCRDGRGQGTAVVNNNGDNSYPNS